MLTLVVNMDQTKACNSGGVGECYVLCCAAGSAAAGVAVASGWVAGEFSLVGVLYVFVGWDKKVWSV